MDTEQFTGNKNVDRARGKLLGKVLGGDLSLQIEQVEYPVLEEVGNLQEECMSDVREGR